VRVGDWYSSSPRDTHDYKVLAVGSYDEVSALATTYVNVTFGVIFHDQPCVLFETNIPGHLKYIAMVNLDHFLDGIHKIND
jgi:hypothetical protein